MQERLAVLLVAAFALALACNKQGGETATPGADAATATAARPSMDDLERELAQRRGELEQHGAREQGTPTADRAVDAGDDAAGTRCTRTCELATAICGLREQICELAGEHEDEPGSAARYAAVCSRASEDCDRATEACDDCST